MSEIFSNNDEMKSIIRVVDRVIKRVSWCSFEDKKKIFAAVLRRANMAEHIKIQMMLNAEQTENEADFFRYLKNSKNFYEKRLRAQKQRQDKLNKNAKT